MVPKGTAGPDLLGGSGRVGEAMRLPVDASYRGGWGQRWYGDGSGELQTEDSLASGHVGGGRGVKYGHLITIGAVAAPIALSESEEPVSGPSRGGGVSSGTNPSSHGRVNTAGSTNDSTESSLNLHPTGQMIAPNRGTFGRANVRRVIPPKRIATGPPTVSRQTGQRQTSTCDPTVDLFSWGHGTHAQRASSISGKSQDSFEADPDFFGHSLES